MGIDTNDKQINYSHGPRTNQVTSWLVCSWSTFGARMNYGQT
jgi:hypothetical protein